jgi:anti-anti-sigma factor
MARAGARAKPRKRRNRRGAESCAEIAQASASKAHPRGTVIETTSLRAWHNSKSRAKVSAAASPPSGLVRRGTTEERVMEFTVKNTPNTTELFLSGRMTFADHDKFRNLIATFDGPAGHGMVFDLSDVEFVDSSGLGMFIIARDTAQKKNLEFTIRGARDEVKRLFTIAKFNKMFNIVD